MSLELAEGDAFGVYLCPFSFSSGIDLAGCDTALTGQVLKGREITDAEDLV